MLLMQSFTGPQVEEGAIPEVVAMETTTVEAATAEPAVEQTTTSARKPKVQTQVESQPGLSSKAMVREAMVEDATPLRSAPMPETGTSSCGGLELLDEELIDPTVVALNLESWRRTEQWVKVRCEYPE
jgi:hypothetical protein